MVQQGCECQDGVIINHLILAFRYFAINYLDQPGYCLAVKLSKWQVKGKKLACQRIQQWVWVQKKGNEESNRKVLEL